MAVELPRKPELVVSRVLVRSPTKFANNICLLALLAKALQIRVTYVHTTHIHFLSRFHHWPFAIRRCQALLKVHIGTCLYTTVHSIPQECTVPAVDVNARAFKVCF